MGRILAEEISFILEKRSGFLQHRVQCPFCPLTFAYKQSMQRHVRQQHSNNPLRFPCTIFGIVLAKAQTLKLHVEVVHADEPPSFDCWYCHATFTGHNSRQRHARIVHGRKYREAKINLQLHLKHLSKGDDFQDEWMFVESRPIQPGEHHPCGQTPIQIYFFLENKWNGNRTFDGSKCIYNQLKHHACTPFTYR